MSTAYEMLRRALELQNQGDFDAAEKLYTKVLKIKPDNFDALHLLGILKYQRGEYDRALDLVGDALKINPASVEAMLNYGSILCALNRHEESLSYFDRALARNPFFPSALNNRGNALAQLGRHEEAAICLKKALALKPDDPQTLFNYGFALRELNRHDEALSCFEQVIKLKPRQTLLLNNCGKELALLGRANDALACFDRVLELSPNDVDALWQSALSRLSLGDFAQGWKTYESRWQVAEFPSELRHTSLPRWNGERIQGTLLAWAEQGLGDEILYGGMIPELTAYADSVAAEVEPRLVKLFTRSFPGVRVFARGQAPPHAAAQVPFGSLGRYLRPSWQAFPQLSRGYLVADAALAASLRERLSPHGETVIGLSWVSKNPLLGRSKTAPLSDFVPVLRQPGCRFVDLQYGDTSAEREALKQETGICIDRLEDIDNTYDIDGLAALIAACDVVVTVSNTTAHLAGALGKPTVVLVPFGTARIWYWFYERHNSPWYPGMRIHRQQQGQSWGKLIESAIGELGELVATAKRLQPA